MDCDCKTPFGGKTGALPPNPRSCRRAWSSASGGAACAELFLAYQGFQGLRRRNYAIRELRQQGPIGARFTPFTNGVITPAGHDYAIRELRQRNYANSEYPGQEEEWEAMNKDV